MIDRTRELLTELVKLRSAWESRIVEVRTGDLTTTLFLNFGEIAAVKASKPGEPLGRLLLRKGLISREHYVEVLERLGDVLSTGERVAFGEVAVGLGYTQAEHVSTCLAEQVRALVMRVFQGPAPEWTVLPAPENRDPSRDLTMRVEAIFLEAIRLVDDARRGELGLDAARPLALRATWDLQEIDVRFELGAEEADLVRVAVAGDKTVDQLLASSAIGGVDARPLLTALVASGAVESRAPVEAEKQEKPARRKEPPPLPAWATVDATKAKDAAETAVRARRSNAPNAPKRETKSPVEQMLLAEQIFERGREAFVKGDVKAAAAEFDRALAVHPGSLEHRVFARWSHHRLSGAKLEGANRDELERLAREALQENPRFAIAHLVLSAVHESAGRAAEARAEQTRARELDRELFDNRAPVAAPAPAPAPSARKSPALAIAVAAVVLVGVGVAVAFASRGSASGGAVTPAASATTTASTPAATATTPAPPASASATKPVAVANPLDAAPSPRATASAVASASPTPPVDPHHGNVLLPKSAEGHRLFVDGKNYADSNPLVLLCGHHELRIGSAGTPRPIDVPCGGQLDLR